MAKLTDKSAIVTLSLSDLIHVVDVDDLTSDPLGTSKKASISQIVALAGGGPTHTGEVTGATALIVDKTAITNKTTVTGVSGDFVLISDTSDAGNLKKVDVVDFLGGAADGNGIYTGSGSLTATTTVTMGANDLLFASTGGVINIQTALNITGTNELNIGGGGIVMNNAVSGLNAIWLNQSTRNLASMSLTQAGSTQISNVVTGGKFQWRYELNNNTAELQEGSLNTHWFKIGRTLVSNQTLSFGANIGFGIGSGQLQMNARPTDKIKFGSYDGTTFVEKVTIQNADGNVGIGTAAPTDKLQVVGDLNATRYKVNGVAGANFSGAVTNITIVDGLVTAAS